MSESIRKHLEKVYGAKDLEQLAEGYAEWAEKYDRDVMAMGYQTPGIVAGMMGRHVPPSRSPILDCGAGTGLLGLLLAGLGYRGLAAMDMSEEMLEVARGRGCYDDVRPGVLGEALDYPDAHFAAVAAAGVFTVGHAPADAYDEIVRILQPAGHFIVSERVDGEANADYRARRERHEDAGRWQRVDQSELLVIFPLEPSEADLRHQVYVYRRA